MNGSLAAELKELRVAALSFSSSHINFLESIEYVQGARYSYGPHRCTLSWFSYQRQKRPFAFTFLSNLPILAGIKHLNHLYNNTIGHLV